MTFVHKTLSAVIVPTKQKKLKLVGTDGNAWALMGTAQEHNRKHKMYQTDIFKQIMKECMAGDYDHLLATLIYFFEVK